MIFWRFVSYEYIFICLGAKYMGFVRKKRALTEIHALTFFDFGVIRKEWICSTGHHCPASPSKFLFVTKFF